MRVADAENGRSGTSDLARALAEGRRIREFLVVGDVIEVETAYVGMQSAEVHTPQRADVNLCIVAEFYPADMVIVSGRAIEQVYADLIAVEAEVDSCAFVAAAQVGHVQRVAKEYPSPTEVRTDLVAGGRRQVYTLLVAVGYTVHLVGVRVLQHDRIVIFLRLDVVGVKSGKVFGDAVEPIQELIAQMTLGCGCRCEQA